MRRVLVDTNVLVRAVRSASPKCLAARLALKMAYRSGVTLCVAPQNVAEFWNVCTRPSSSNGLGMSIDEAERQAGRIERFFAILPDSIESYRISRRLVFTNGVVGVKVHDARLAATMQAYGITRILTFNVRDFERFAGIEAVHPEAVAA